MTQVLDDADRARIQSLRRVEDRARSTLGVVLAKTAIATERGVVASSVVIERSCGRCDRPHGKPRTPGIEFSIAHSGSCVVVAVSSSAAVGIDVEQTARFLGGTVRLPTVGGSAVPARDGAVDWCRREAVAKATGDGVAAPLSAVNVTEPSARPAVVGYRGRPLAAAIGDLQFGDEYVGAVAALTDRRLHVDIHEAHALLTGSG